MILPPLLILACLLIQPTRLGLKYLLFRLGKSHSKAGPVLIAVAAQHPLQDGITPGPGYRLRLERALKIYEGVKAKIVICGSLHRGDKIPLWQAGMNYLLERGVPKTDLIVLPDAYNCMEECLAFGQYYRTAKQATLLEVVEPRHKALRNKIAFLWMAGWVPLFTLTDENPTLKQCLGELVLTLYTFFLDPDWQSSCSPMRWLSWRTRRVPQS